MKTENALLIGAGIIALLIATKRGASVGAIVKDAPPGVTKCRDGRYSTFLLNRGTCAYHGGAEIKKVRRKKNTDNIPKSVIDEFLDLRRQHKLFKAKFEAAYRPKWFVEQIENPARVLLNKYPDLPKVARQYL